MKEIKITEKTKNSLLGRTKVNFEIVQGNEPVPSRLQVREVLAKNLKKDKELIIIKKIESEFGNANVKGEALVYDSKEILAKVAPEYYVKRIKVKEEALAKVAEEKKKKQEEAAKETEKAEEEKSEEKKEESSEEKNEAEKPKEDSKKDDQEAPKKESEEKTE